MSFADRIKGLVKHPNAVAERRVAEKRELVLAPLVSVSAEPVDLAKEARRQLRSKRARCQHLSVRNEGRREVCRECGDRFPCSGDRCFHLNCIVTGYQRGLRAGFPRDYPLSLVVLDGIRVELDTTDADPAKWTTPVPLEAP